jgi:hypothetical protein
MSFLLALWLAVLPKGVILVQGAMPSASDTSTPLPEQGSAVPGRYRNAYFGLTYPIPAGWKEQPAGPPPSESGNYVLTQYALFDPDQQDRPRAHVLLTAQDLFFSPLAAVDARELVAATRRQLAPTYHIENGPDEVTIAGRPFSRLAYSAAHAGLHWRILSTDTRCHALTFTFTGSDPAVLDEAERSLRAITLRAGAPHCLPNYARPANILTKTDPTFTQRYNTIPARLLIDAKGRVKHIHLLSAFPEQSEPILTALRAWRFKPYLVQGRAVEVETGMVFGMPGRVGGH